MPEMRGSLFTKKRRIALIEANRRGAAVSAQADAAGVSRACLYRWIDIGRREVEDKESGRIKTLGPYGRWYQQYILARGQTSVQIAERFTESAKTDPDKSVVWLEKMHPDEFGKRMSVTTRQETPVKLILVEKDGREWLQHQGNSLAALDTTFVPDDESTQNTPLKALGGAEKRESVEGV